jgi:hypothetical protein
MRKCIICGIPLNNENKSKEHIIHNAIGGTLEDEGIYCKKCNAKYGSRQDKDFIQIFAPIVAKINMHKTRNTKGTSYTGVMYDQDNNLYTATYKAGKVVKFENADSEYVKYEEGKFKPLYYHFDLNNDAFKLGITKIAFNYAIYCGLPTCCLEKIFDCSTKKIIDKPIVIPFIPMTSFDEIMENHPVESIFHAVRIFNCGNTLCAYIELFNTFQHYVILSEKYNFAKYGNIDKSYGNIIEMNEPLEKELLESVTPRDYKDADIIRRQYNIDTDKLLKDLKEYHNYDCLDCNEQENMLFTHIGKKAYEKNRTQPYIKEYKELINHHYDSIDWLKEGLSSKKNIEHMGCFYQSFQFYTMDDDCVNIDNYKKFLPNDTDYPTTICMILNNRQKIKSYCHRKFYMLMDRLN